MDKKKLPIKYQIGIWKTLPNYPTKNDILYELQVHVSKMKTGEFSEQTFNGIWYDEGGVANWRGTKIEAHLESIINDSAIVEQTKCDEKTGKQWYKIVGSPWS